MAVYEKVSALSILRRHTPRAAACLITLATWAFSPPAKPLGADQGVGSSNLSGCAALFEYLIRRREA